MTTTDVLSAPPNSSTAVEKTLRGIGIVSAVAACVAVIALLLVMVTEIVMRYWLAAPLGWNVSLVERVLMPASVFLALPWLYVSAGHVSAGVVYERLPQNVQLVARVTSFSLVVLLAALLFYSGARGSFESFVLGDVPAPGTSDIKIPTWIWQSFQPIGALGLLTVALLDGPRFLREGDHEDGAVEG